MKVVIFVSDEFQLFSDIGGAAGLMLGMSFTTFVPVVDLFLLGILKSPTATGSKILENFYQQIQEQ